jgi:hypothetical protein
MRQVGTGEQEAQRRKRIMQIFSVALLVLLGVSTLGYSFISNPNLGSNTQTTANSGVQQISDSQWTITVGQNQIVVNSPPAVISNVTFEATPNLADFMQKTVYIDASDSITNELSSALGPYVSRLQPACYGSCTKNLPEIGCGNSSTDELIVWRESSNQIITKQGSCYFVNGSTKTADAFLYKTFGISNQ